MGIGRVAVGHPPGVHLGARLGLVEHHLLLGGEAGGQGDLGAEHRRQPDGAGRLGEADDPVEAVVIGDGEGVEAQSGRLGGQLLRVRRAVEEREVGVAVELGVGHSALPLPETVDVTRGLERLPPPAPRRAVATGVPRRAAGCSTIATSRLLAFGSPLARQGRFELLPRPRRVVEPHCASIERLSAERKFGRGSGDQGVQFGSRPNAARRAAEGSSNAPSRRGPISPAPR